MAEEDPGDDVLFHQNIDLPPEVIRDVTVSDILPVGLIYKSESLNIRGAGSRVTQAVSDPNDGSEEVKITLSLGEVNNTGDQDILISFETVVADVPENKAGAVIPPRSASLCWRDTEGFLHTSSAQSKEVHVIEPDLLMERSMVESNGTVAVTLSIRHSSQSMAPAFDVDLVDSLPQGMSLCPGSAEILSGPSGGTESGPSRLKWHFDLLDSSWTREDGVVLSYMANISREAQEAPGPRASLVWTSMPGEDPDERAYLLKEEGSLLRRGLFAGLSITMTDAPDPVCAYGTLNYTIRYRNSGQEANDAVVQAIYDGNLSFISASPEPDEGTDDRWTIGDLPSGDEGVIRVAVRVRQASPSGSGLVSEAEISAGELNARADAQTTVSAMGIAIEASCTREVLSPGSFMNYTLCFRNDGQEDATNLTVTDILDDRLLFDETKDASPPPSEIWKDKRGVLLHWKADALGTEVIHPGQSGQISLRVQLPSGPDYSGIEHLSNLYRIDSDQFTGEFRSLETFVVRSLFIRKRAEKESYSEGDDVNYTIVYGNELSTDLTDAEITDLLPDVEYLGASPEPDYKENRLLVWRPGRIPAHSSAVIRLMVRIKERPDLRFWESQSVSGSGFLSSVQALGTARPIRELINRAKITAYRLGAMEQDSCSSSIRLLDAQGIKLQRARHGSGYSNATGAINYSARDGISVLEQSLSRFSPVTLPLSRENLTLASMWADRMWAENSGDEKLSESSLYMDLIEKKALLFLEPNQTALTSEELISGGKAEMSYRQKGPEGFMDVSESYHGDFRIDRSLDSRGSRASYSASISGRGFASSKKRMDSSSSAAESSWHGSGSLDSEEMFSNDPLVYKNVDMVYGVCSEKAGSFSANYSSLWGEGTAATEKRLGSLVSSKASTAGRLQKEVLMDSSSLSVLEKFEGRETAKAVVSKGTMKSLIWEQDLAGNYTQALRLSLRPVIWGLQLRPTHKAPWMRGGEPIFGIDAAKEANKTQKYLTLTSASGILKQV